MDAINILVAHANKFYALGNYEEAVENYAHAVEDLANLNGPENVANADVMLLYGKALVKLALQKSEVLGNPAPAEQASPVKAETLQAGAQYSFQGDDADYEDASSASEADQDKIENISSEDDFQNAWEVLDLARVLYSNRLKSIEEATEQKATKTRLAETYDLLGEVSLENGTAARWSFKENFTDVGQRTSIKRFPTSRSHLTLSWNYTTRHQVKSVGHTTCWR